MPPLRRISWFFLCCVLIYALLVVPWPGVMGAYRAYFRASGNLVFGAFGSKGAVVFNPRPGIRKGNDTRLTLRKRRPPFPEADIDINSRMVAYRPTAFIIALCLATPIPWSRRWQALVWGLVGVQAFIAFRVGLFLLDVFSNGNSFAIYSFSPLVKGLLTPAATILFRSPAIHYVGPMFVWLLVVFRRNDVMTVFAGSGKVHTAKRGLARSGRSR